MPPKPPFLLPRHSLAAAAAARAGVLRVGWLVALRVVFLLSAALVLAGQPYALATGALATGARATDARASGVATAGAATPAATPSAQATTAPTRWPGWSVDAFQHVSTAEGLPNEVTIAIAEDQAGFIWVGTMGGVARWDGHEFRTQRFDAGAPGSLPDNVVQVLHRDSRGRLWVGTSGGGLVRLVGTGAGPAHRVAGPQGLAHVSVRALADDGAGGLWVASEGGLDHIDADTGAVRREAMGAHSENGLRGQGAVAVLRDRRGRLWVGTTLGLFVRDGDGQVFRAVPLQPTAGVPGNADAGAAVPPRPETLLEDSAGRLWIGTNRHGAFVIDGDFAPPRQVQETGLPPGTKALPARRVMALLEARPGEVWIGTLGQGIVAVDNGSGRTRRLMHRPLLPAGLPDDQVRGLYRDRAGLVWVATYGGLSRIDPRATALLAVSAAAVEPDKVRARADYSSLLAHSDGRVWMGTLSQGLDIVDPRTGALQSLRPDSRRPTAALPSDALVSLAEAADGRVFVASYRGLYRVSAPNASAAGRAAAAPRVARMGWPGRAPEAGVGPLLRDGTQLWIGGLTDGLWLMDLGSGRVHAAIADPARQLSDRRITALARGNAGELWIGTRNGLNRFDPASGRIQTLAPGDPAQGRLGSGFIASLLIDRGGRLWVGTYGGGLHVLEGDGAGVVPRFRRVAVAQGLPDDNVNSVVQDDAGRIWVSTDSGLAVVDAATLATRALRRAEGSVYSAYWTGSAARTEHGELLFGASGGLTVVRPALLEHWAYRPPVVATEVRVGGRPVAVDGQPLRVAADANSLSVEYAALDYSAPARNRYAHRLVGFDKDWITTDARRRVASYSQLPPGDYQLQIRGSNREGLFSDATLTLPVHVAAAWHQTWWARAAALLLALLLVWLVVQRRTHVLQARRRELERLVDERTAELKAVSHALTEKSRALGEKSRALEEKSRVLELASISDPLTGLHNRRFLAEQIDAALSASLRRAQATPAHSGAAVDTDTLFFLIDVDHFKRVNDAFGHAAGDTVLVQLAQRLKVLMRDSDDLVRWGGEEFLAVARDTDRGRADELAERLRRGVSGAPFTLDDGRELQLTCSIGHAAWPFLAQDAQALNWQAVVNLADLGLLAAKRMGRDAWVGLHAGPSAQPHGLVARVGLAPQQALDDGEISVSSSHAAATAVATALAPD